MTLQCLLTLSALRRGGKGGQLILQRTSRGFEVYNIFRRNYLLINAINTVKGKIDSLLFSQKNSLVVISYDFYDSQINIPRKRLYY